MKYLLALFFTLSTLHAQDLSANETKDLLARLAAKRGNSGIQAEFRDEKHLSLMQKPVIESGTVSYLPPDKFRREVKGGGLTVCDGQVLWLYYPQFQSAEKYTLSANRTLRDSIHAMTAGLGLQDLSSSFEVKAVKTQGGYALTLNPKSSSLRKSFTFIQIDLSDSLYAKKMEISATNGDRTVTTFSNEHPANLSISDFQFMPPKGVTVSEPMK
ncbi:hypothetical protein BH09VER1_BH09VER1_08540 [soil metagenome]